ncbi:hypothetical protein ABS71_03995 [bacterium SCN 62-11]|nr:hypothetical protein [Candidatus Eremiobacteraeota bacterium]ODT75839.1 MAG: hypothetical protein ABS71_03995 [bacterium SCN 62-11]
MNLLPALVVIPISWAICLLISKVFAMWSPGRARRAFYVSWILVALCGAAAAFFFLAPGSNSKGGDIFAALVGVFCLLCMAGALLNVVTCWVGARREAQAAARQDDGTGISRQHS